MSTSNERCPNCGQTGLESIYKVSGVPVHNVVLIDEVREAREFPRGDIDIGFCEHCTFATNTAFDPAYMHYDTRCEETQSASGTFNEFHERLADELIRRYNLRGGTVVEIGCGKGEFLAMVCKAAGSRGIGFDPAYVPGRIDMPEGVEVLRENFTGRQDLGDADLVCCKMTLEHIRDTREFLIALRRSIGRSDTAVFFQVPDAARIYRERAFWDIYYEHCSYFTETALVALFTGTGFDVEDVSATYGAQYLAIFARAAENEPIAGARPGSTIREAVDAFSNEVESVKSRWRDLVSREHRAGKRIAIWGGGSKAVSFLTSLGLGEEITFVVDINERKHDTYLPGTGHRVAAPAELAADGPDLVIVMNSVYHDEVQQRLAALGLEPRLVCLP